MAEHGKKEHMSGHGSVHGLSSADRNKVGGKGFRIWGEEHEDKTGKGAYTENLPLSRPSVPGLARPPEPTRLIDTGRMEPSIPNRGNAGGKRQVIGGKLLG